ncbi:MAG TPA: hypothetical protein EYN72_11405 [Dehalococcoidia bacterium]|nr:hypothetical protein [Dehalococcoidia bacterium]
MGTAAWATTGTGATGAGAGGAGAVTGATAGAGAGAGAGADSGSESLLAQANAPTTIRKNNPNTIGRFLRLGRNKFITFL